MIILLYGYSSPILLLFIPSAIIIAEIIAEFLKLGFTKRWSIASGIYSAGIRGINDAGRLVGNLGRFRVHGIMEPFDYSCTGESIQYERKVAFTKTVLHLLAVILVIQYF